MGTNARAGGRPEPQTYAWASLAATLAIWAFLGLRLTESGTVIEMSPGHLAWTYGAVVVLLVLAHALIAAVLAWRRRGPATRDPRDYEIATRADRIAATVVLVGINVLVIQVLAEASATDRILPNVDTRTVPSLVFVLLSVLFAGHVARQVATLWMYRTAPAPVTGAAQ